MLESERNKINQKIYGFFIDIDKRYGLSKLSPLLFQSLKNFSTNNGKRIRPIMFLIGYKGFSSKRPRELYTTALSIELLHNFMLIHDDIIDKSNTRRNKPAMHISLQSAFNKYPNKQFTGQDLAIIAGDIMYSIAFDAFTAIKENPNNKERALKEFIKAGIYTGCGEFIEIVSGAKPLKSITKNEIFKIYDYKTSHYTFASPLSMGAALAGANDKEIIKLQKIGRYIGRGFQIKDDVLSLFEDEKKLGKSVLSDIQESKKTFFIWHAYTFSSRIDRKKLTTIMNKKNVTYSDLREIREISKKTRTLQAARKEVNGLLQKAQKIIQSSRIRPYYQKKLFEYTRTVLEF